MTKTYKIGEYVLGGIVTITHTTNNNQDNYSIKFIDYFDKKILVEGEFTKKQDAENFLCTHGTSYYADKIINFRPK